MKLIKTKEEAAEEPEEDVKLDEWKKAPAAPKEWLLRCIIPFYLKLSHVLCQSIYRN